MVEDCSSGGVLLFSCLKVKSPLFPESLITLPSVSTSKKTTESLGSTKE